MSDPIATTLESTSGLDGSSRPRVVEGLIVDRTADGGVILLHPNQPRWALTDESGLEVARCLDGLISLADLSARIARDSDGVHHEQEILADLLNFTAQLRDAALLDSHAPRHTASPQPRRPPNMTIYVTEQCNLRCKHCATVEGKMPETALTADAIRGLIDQHQALFPGAAIAFLGGEPLLHPDCLDLVEYACTKSRAVSIGTNGHLVDEVAARRLAACGVTVQVSLDGADSAVHDSIRGKGSFEKAWRAVERLCAAGAGPRTIVSTVLTRGGISDVKALVARCRALGVSKVRCLPLRPVKAAKTNWEQIEPSPEDFFEITRWAIFDANREGGPTLVEGSFPGFVPQAATIAGHWCPIGETMIVNSQGAVHNCPAIIEAQSNAGNALRAPLTEILAGEKNNALRDVMLQRRYAVEECRTCAWRNFCQGGCMAFSYHRSGDLYINDEFCEFRRELYREFVTRSAAAAPGEQVSSAEACD